MSQDFTTPATPDQALLLKLQGLNTIGTISYVLHLIVAVAAFIPGGQFGMTLLVVALILDMVKGDDAAGTWHASHFRWRIRSVIFAGLAYLLTFPLFLLLYFPGAIAWAVISLWFLYRIVTGFMAMNKGQEIGA
ncbi:COG3671 Predicted membrane protein [Comamonadaceae bacterium]